MTADELKKRAATIKKQLLDAQTSINVLFLKTEPTANELGVINILRKSFILAYHATITATIKDIHSLVANPQCGAERYWRVCDSHGDSIDCINQLASQYYRQPLLPILEQAVFDSLFFNGIIRNSGTEDFDLDNTTKFMLCHAERVCSSPQSMKAYIALLDDSCPKEVLSRVRPEIVEMLSGEPSIKQVQGSESTAAFKALVGKFVVPDVFENGRVFRYIDEQFSPADLSWIRAKDDFFGYFGVRHLFEDYYATFVQGKNNLPLLVSSLPGLGKTHFAISYALAQPELTLILVGPDDLEKSFEPLISKLAKRMDRRFVLFFDDIDPNKVNWYYFRTNVGGSLSLPDNISIVIASNFEYPANILSRGRAIKFPMFDEIRCVEMIEEFLKSRGMKHCPWELSSVIAADYLEEFSQHKFEELSPRTLIHYLELYGKDIRRRKRMLEMSRAEVIPKPDPQTFYEFNIKLMKILYGDDVLDVLREERLKQEIGVI